jgi:signal transduction histidine kinase
VDVALATALFVGVVLAVPPTPVSPRSEVPPLDAAGLAVVALACTALLWRRTRPVAVWGAIGLLGVLQALAGTPPVRLVPVLVIALYAVAAYTDRRRAVICAAVTVTAALTLLAWTTGDVFDSPLGFAVAGWSVLPAILGDAVRSGRQTLKDAVQRAQAAEHSRDTEAARQVAEERLRISRELHDVVGHHIAVINVQAGVAEHLLRTDPAQAVAALQQVREASSLALAETGQLVRMMRTDDDATTAGGPAPTLAALPALVEEVRDSGSPVSWRHTGPAPDIGAAGGLHAFRIVQEALTNARRHGDGDVQLVTEQRPDRLVVEVSNRVAGDEQAAPSGHGLVGMHERAVLCGGELRTQHVGGRFVVTVVLPVTGVLAGEEDR